MGDWSRESWELDVTALDLALKEPFHYSGGSIESLTNVFVTLRFASVSGVGEACPDEASGETVESVIKELEEVDPRALINPFNLEGVIDILPTGAARGRIRASPERGSGCTGAGRIPNPARLTAPQPAFTFSSLFPPRSAGTRRGRFVPAFFRVVAAAERRIGGGRQHAGRADRSAGYGRARHILLRRTRPRGRL